MKNIYLLLTLFFITLSTPLFAANTANENVSPNERAKIESVVHQYLINKPEVLVEAMQSLQRKQYEEAQQTVKKTQQEAPQYINALFNQPGDPIGGNSKGKITIVEFFDYQCPHCVSMTPIINAIIKANPDVRVVYKEFPIRGPVSILAARAALAANKQGKYNTFSHALLSTKQPITEELIYNIAKENGLNVEQLKKDINDRSIENQIKNNVKLAQELKLFGTPAFFIGKSDAKSNNAINYIPGHIDQKQLQSIIDQVAQS